MKPITVIERPRTVNTGNIVQRIRRIRHELAQMLEQCDDALERIAIERKS